MIKFVVLSRQRSGSTLLVRSLSSHPQIQCHGEIFLAKNTRLPTYEAYRTASLKRRLAHPFFKKWLIYNFLAEVYTSAAADIEALGFKLMYGQAREFWPVKNWIKDDDVRVIHLIRTNMLKTILSSKTSKVRQVAHSTKPVAPIKVHLDPVEIKMLLNKMTKQLEVNRRLFADHPHLEITYEGFVANRDQETDRMLDFLGIESFTPLTSDLVKLSSDSLEDLIENYDEIAQTLTGTAYEKFLD